MTVRIINADVMDGLAQLPDESVHCVVTSPPYWGLRDYGTAKWEGGDPECDHKGAPLISDRSGLAGYTNENVKLRTFSVPFRDLCGKCGAKRIDKQLGLEPTLGEHVEAMVRIFREVRRVLRKDGTLWLNYGDSYATSVNGRSAADTKAIGNDDRTFRDKPFSTVGRVGKSGNKGNSGSDCLRRNWAEGDLKPKDLCGVPWRVAFALQADGWWLRQDIIWSKPNPMPESVKDRCTKAHEYLFLLAKSERYYFDAEAIAEPITASTAARLSQDIENQEGSYRVPGKTNGPMKAVGKNRATFRGSSYCHNESFNNNADMNAKGVGSSLNETGTRNKRSVWEIATQPFPEAHFATFPPALIEPCIRAGSKIGDTILDPFGGSGTAGLVADRLKRNAILIELNPEYAAMAEKRIKGDCPMFAEVS